MKLLTLKPEGKFVFVGDIHGDLEASEKVINKYLRHDTKICFLGDYIDRGHMSKENINYLLKTKKENPENIFLLQGNHENYCVVGFSPADFWKSMDFLEQKKYQEIFRKFPLAVSIGDIIALHGALPDVKYLDDINKINEGELDKNWMAVLWGDFYNGDEDYDEGISSRPLYGERYFDNVMNRLSKKVLIRSHQPDADEVMFNKRCLTIFTSKYYMKKRTIAILDFDKKKRINNVDDLEIEII